jgi:molybdate transport system substrate-binding protein
VGLLALVVTLALTAPPPRPLTVSAAISLTDVLAVLGPMYTKGGGAPVHFNYAASNVLARQIVNGAPVDVFISADEVQMEIAAAAGAIDPGTRVKLLGNAIVVARRRGLPNASSGWIAALRDARSRRIAIGDPEAVPAGVYAKRLLMKEGLWDELQPKLVPVASVRAALTAVYNGSADAAFVYASDVFSYRGTAIEGLPVGWAPDLIGIVYPAAVVSSTRHRAEAARFLTFLCGAEAATVFEQHRFKPLRCK